MKSAQLRQIEIFLSDAYAVAERETAFGSKDVEIHRQLSELLQTVVTERIRTELRQRAPGDEKGRK